MTKKKIILITIVVVLIILLIPYRKNMLWDGGSVEYKALLYKVKNVHTLDNGGGHYEGIEIEILGIKVFDNTKLINEKPNNSGLDLKLLQCLENELGGYLVTENDQLVDIPLSEIKGANEEKIAYFKGAYASNNPDNMYLMVYPVNGTYNVEEMNKFNDYISSKVLVYQIFEGPNIPMIYIHTKDNSIDIKDLTNKCTTPINENKTQSIDSSTIENLKNTNKIIIKDGEKELGVVTDTNKIQEILNAISSAKKSGDVCLSDNYGFTFEMYNHNTLIDTIDVWNDGKRILPESIKSCYFLISNGTDLRKIIEQETDIVFYSILDYSDTCVKEEELIYQNNNHKYYLNCQKSDKVMIKFMIENKVMLLKEALKNNYISADKVASEYPNVLIKK